MTTISLDTPHVPFLDLARSHADIKSDLLGDFAALDRPRRLHERSCRRRVRGRVCRVCRHRPRVGPRRAASTRSGSGSLAAGIKPGDEVIVPANTFVATLEGVTRPVALPVVVDMSERDWNLDVDARRRSRHEPTRFVVPVHLYGQMADMRALGRSAAKRDLVLVEDAARLTAPTRDGVARRLGRTCGRLQLLSRQEPRRVRRRRRADDGRRRAADELRALREHGQRTKYAHDREGWTARLDTIQALVLLQEAQAARRAGTASARGRGHDYLTALEGVGDLELPPVAPRQLAGVAPLRRPYRRPGRTRGVPARTRHRHGPALPDPVHLDKAYEWLGLGPGAVPGRGAARRARLSLPVFPGMRREQAEAVTTSVRAFFGDD